MSRLVSSDCLVDAVYNSDHFKSGSGGDLRQVRQSAELLRGFGVSVKPLHESIGVSEGIESSDLLGLEIAQNLATSQQIICERGEEFSRFAED